MGSNNSKLNPPRFPGDNISTKPSSSKNQFSPNHDSTSQERHRKRQRLEAVFPPKSRSESEWDEEETSGDDQGIFSLETQIRRTGQPEARGIPQSNVPLDPQIQQADPSLNAPTRPPALGPNPGPPPGWAAFGRDIGISREWRIGLVVNAPHHRPDTSNDNHRDRPDVVCSKIGTYVHSKKRKFVVVKLGAEHTLLPIYTHGGNGLSRQNDQRKRESIGIRDLNSPLVQRQWTEAPSENRPNLIYRVVPEHQFRYGLSMLPKSYVHFGGPVTFNPRVPVEIHGSISQDDTARLLRLFIEPYIQILAAPPLQLQFYTSAELQAIIRQERREEQGATTTRWERIWHWRVQEIQANAAARPPEGTFEQLPLGAPIRRDPAIPLYRFVPSRRIGNIGAGNVFGQPQNQYPDPYAMPIGPEMVFQHPQQQIPPSYFPVGIGPIPPNQQFPNPQAQPFQQNQQSLYGPPFPPFGPLPPPPPP